MTLIKLENISQVFGFSEATKIALEQINMTIEAGDFIAVMGVSGAGKSCLLNIIGLLNKPTHGMYTFLEHEITQISQSQRVQLRRHNIGFVFQNFNLLPYLTVLDNISLPLTYSSNISFLKRVKVVKRLLNRLGVYGKEFLYPYQLNNGQSQRVAIARALINQPAVIIADEPTGNLNSTNTDIVMGLLQNINEQGGTIIMATNNPLLTKYANRIIYLHDGQIRINQKLATNEQVDFGKMQNAIKRQNLQQKTKIKSQEGGVTKSQRRKKPTI